MYGSSDGEREERDDASIANPKCVSFLTPSPIGSLSISLTDVVVIVVVVCGSGCWLRIQLHLCVLKLIIEWWKTPISPYLPSPILSAALDLLFKSQVYFACCELCLSQVSTATLPNFLPLSLSSSSLYLILLIVEANPILLRLQLNNRRRVAGAEEEEDL